MTLLAIDPGTTESGWVILEKDRITRSGIDPNETVLANLEIWHGTLAVEMIASYGMPVGKEVFDTCVWVGRFLQAYESQWQRYDGLGIEPGHETRVIYRREVKLHLCGSAQAKDANIRQALIDMFGPPGTKKAPGGTYGIKSHMWAALGVAATVRQLERKDTTT